VVELEALPGRGAGRGEAVLGERRLGMARLEEDVAEVHVPRCARGGATDGVAPERRVASPHALASERQDGESAENQNRRERGENGTARRGARDEGAEQERRAE